MTARLARVARLEQRRGAIFVRRWHQIVVDGQTDEEAIADYELENGAILGQNEGVILRVIVEP